MNKLLTISKMFKKNRTSLFLIALLLFSFTVSPVASSSYAAGRRQNVVVLPITALGIKSEYRSILTEVLIGVLSRSGEFNFISGKIVESAMKEAFKEQLKSDSEFCDEMTCLRAVAGDFGTDLILTTKVVKDADTDIISIKIEDINVGSMISQIDDECHSCGISALKKKLKGLAGRLVGTSPSPSPQFKWRRGLKAMIFMGGKEKNKFQLWPFLGVLASGGGYYYFEQEYKKNWDKYEESNDSKESKNFYEKASTAQKNKDYAVWAGLGIWAINILYTFIDNNDSLGRQGAMSFQKTIMSPFSINVIPNHNGGLLLCTYKF